MEVLNAKRRELLSERLTELGNYTIASLFISQFLSDKSFDIPVAIIAVLVGGMFYLTGLLFSR